MVISRKQLSKIIKEECFDKALNDIELSKGTTLAIFILEACFIDVMAGFRFGVTREDIDKNQNSAEKFKAFVREYLPQYNANDLYKSLRCGLVHNYTDYGKYVFRNDDPPDKKHKHRDKTEDGKTYIIDKYF